MTRGLSKLQRRILGAIATHTCNDYSDPDNITEVKYSTIFRAVVDYWAKGVPLIPGERRYLAARAAYSRAVWALVRRGLLEGVALAWCAVPTGEAIRWQGGDPDKPQLKLIGLTDAGWREQAHEGPR